MGIAQMLKIYDDFMINVSYWYKSNWQIQQ